MKKVSGLLPKRQLGGNATAKLWHCAGGKVAAWRQSFAAWRHGGMAAKWRQRQPWFDRPTAAPLLTFTPWHGSPTQGDGCEVWVSVDSVQVWEGVVHSQTDAQVAVPFSPPWAELRIRSSPQASTDTDHCYFKDFQIDGQRVCDAGFPSPVVSVQHASSTGGSFECSGQGLFMHPQWIGGAGWVEGTWVAPTASPGASSLC
eukprot:gene13932-biopygen8689